MRKFLFGGILAVLLFCPLSVGALTVSPPVYDEIEINPGESMDFSVRVTNESESAREFYIDIQTFSAYGEEGEAMFKTVDASYGLAKWIKPGFEKIVLEAGQEMDFPLTIEVPENADPGGHYASLFFTSLPPEAREDRSSVGLGGNLGVLFLVTVPGDILENTELLEFTSDKKFYTQLPVNFDYRVKNNGTVHFKPYGDITITNLIGKKSATVDPNPKGGNVLPSSVRHLSTTWVNDVDYIEKGGFWQNFKNEWKNFALGRYKAQLNLIYGRSGQSVAGELYFWVFPWHVILVAVLIIIIIILLIIGYNKMIIRMARKGKR